MVQTVGSQTAAHPRNIAEMPAQRPNDPTTAAQARGRFFNTGNAFNVQLPPVPDHLFVAEPNAAMDPAAPTGLIACDLSQQLGCAYPATTPLVLARYARIRAGETLTTEFAASGIICYVISGAGRTEGGPNRSHGMRRTCSSCQAGGATPTNPSPTPCCGS